MRRDIGTWVDLNEANNFENGWKVGLCWLFIIATDLVGVGFGVYFLVTYVIKLFTKS